MLLLLPEKRGWWRGEMLDGGRTCREGKGESETEKGLAPHQGASMVNKLTTSRSIIVVMRNPSNPGPAASILRRIG